MFDLKTSLINAIFKIPSLCPARSYQRIKLVFKVEFILKTYLLIES